MVPTRKLELKRQSMTPRPPPKRSLSPKKRTPLAAINGNHIPHSETKRSKRPYSATKNPKAKATASASSKKTKTGERRRQSFGQDWRTDDTKTPRISNRGDGKPRASGKFNDPATLSRTATFQQRLHHGEAPKRPENTARIPLHGRATNKKISSVDSMSSMDTDSDSDSSEHCLVEQFVHRSCTVARKKSDDRKHPAKTHHEQKKRRPARERQQSLRSKRTQNHPSTKLNHKTQQRFSTAGRHQEIHHGSKLNDKFARGSVKLSQTAEAFLGLPLEVGGRETRQVDLSDDELTMDDLRSHAGSIEVVELASRCEDVYGTSTNLPEVTGDTWSEDVEELPSRCEDVYGKSSKRSIQKNTPVYAKHDDVVEELPDFCEDVYGPFHGNAMGNRGPAGFATNRARKATVNRSLYSPPDLWTLPQDDESVNSKTFLFEMNGKSFKHPPLPPGWELHVSKRLDRPFYSHPDYGTTLFCPVRLPLLKHNGSIAPVKQLSGIHTFRNQTTKSDGHGWLHDAYKDDSNSGLSISHRRIETLSLQATHGLDGSEGGPLQSRLHQSNALPLDDGSEGSLTTVSVEIPQGLRLRRHLSRQQQQSSNQPNIAAAVSHQDEQTAALGTGGQGTNSSKVAAKKQLGSLDMDDDDMDTASSASNDVLHQNINKRKIEMEDDDMDLTSSPTSQNLLSSPASETGNDRNEKPGTPPEPALSTTRSGSATDASAGMEEGGSNDGSLKEAENSGTTATAEMEGPTANQCRPGEAKEEQVVVTCRHAQDGRENPEPIKYKTESPPSQPGTEEDEFPLVDDYENLGEEYDNQLHTQDPDTSQSEKAHVRTPNSAKSSLSSTSTKITGMASVSCSYEANKRGGTPTLLGSEKSPTKPSTPDTSDETIFTRDSRQRNENSVGCKTPDSSQGLEDDLEPSNENATLPERRTAVRVAHPATFSQEKVDSDALSKSLSQPSPDLSRDSSGQLPTAVNLDEKIFPNISEDISAIGSPSSSTRSTPRSRDSRGSPHRSVGSLSGVSTEGASACFVDLVAYIPKGRTSVDPLQFLETLPTNGRYKCNFRAKPGRLSWASWHGPGHIIS